MENNRGKTKKIILTDVMEIVIIELPKIYRKRDKQDKLLEWTYFLDNPKSEEVEEIMKENEGIKKANEKLEEISDDEIMQRIAEWKADGIRLENGRKRRFERELREAKEQAQKEGREAGMKEGKAKGLVEGREEGREEGKKEEALKIAKALKDEKTDIDFIIKVTGLTRIEVENI